MGHEEKNRAEDLFTYLKTPVFGPPSSENLGARFAHRMAIAKSKTHMSIAVASLALIVIGGHWTSNNAWAQSAIADLAITSAAPPTATAGAFYTFTFTATGGTPPYSWDASLASPDRPSTTTWFSSPWDEIINGMSFDSSSGVLSGAPVYAGKLPLRVRVTDANYRRLSLAYEFVVAGAGSVRSINNSPPAGAVGNAYSFKFETSWSSILGCDPNIYLIEGSLPPGLSLNVLSGDLGAPPALMARPKPLAPTRLRSQLPPTPPVFPPRPKPMPRPFRSSSPALPTQTARSVPPTGAKALPTPGFAHPQPGGTKVKLPPPR